MRCWLSRCLPLTCGMPNPVLRRHRHPTRQPHRLHQLTLGQKHPLVMLPWQLPSLLRNSSLALLPPSQAPLVVGLDLAEPQRQRLQVSDQLCTLCLVCLLSCFLLCLAMGQGPWVI